MILNYPILHEVPWVPKGKRKSAAYSFFETVPIEIPEVPSEDAPVVVEIAQGRHHVHRIGDEEPATHVIPYRKIAGRWYEPRFDSHDGIMMDAIVADPALLGLARKSDGWGITRSNGTYYGERLSQTIAEGSVTRISSRAALPDGRYGEVPPGYEEDDGRARAARDVASKLVIVDGVVHIRTLEPVLRLDDNFAGSTRWHRIDVVSYNPNKANQDVLHPLSALERLDAYSRAKVAEDRSDRNYFYPLPDIVLHRPDLLDFDPVPVALHEASVACLHEMSKQVMDRSAAYFAAFADLRDQVAPGTSNWVGKLKEFKVDQDMDRNGRYISIVRCLRIHMEEAPRPPYVDDTYGIYPEVRNALDLTPYAPHLEAATLDMARDLGYAKVPEAHDADHVVDHTDEPEEEDLVVIVQQPRIAGPRP